MSFTTLNLLLLILLLIWFWRDSLQVREIATRISKRACESHDVQFLDQTVALRRLRLRWLRSGLKFRRLYEFDYSLEGSGRLTGYIIMLGSHTELLQIEIPETSHSELLH
ncbi:DUF3301 domain-containing protein [endosymbiont of Ridgeia piscesae]|jgi:hypothetical protein|uniref:DUF3301 domain-containing protein n=1 Tax=endosymbiont of Ridgeia piscesae TaxID=54398 RepID=A0A0T5YUB1_9GAMM|nr:DUF3301 domain-containing protein [endosymbiont of Ridgeia piscesae]KRT54208.1 Protein of unknown function (DUF3301) [endosymbiont of Ridgeia piscesae]KRT59388.1 Protein of unknown function (DUF3301) [endosymbiont of Ridgeia piscesae]